LFNGDDANDLPSGSPGQQEAAPIPSADFLAEGPTAWGLDGAHAASRESASSESQTVPAEGGSSTGTGEEAASRDDHVVVPTTDRHQRVPGPKLILKGLKGAFKKLLGRRRRGA